MIYTTMR